MSTIYRYICEENFSHSQAVGRCIVDFRSVLEEKDIRALALYSTMLTQLVKNIDDLEILKSFTKDYLKLKLICDILPIDKLLNDEERDYLEDDLSFIDAKFKEFE